MSHVVRAMLARLTRLLSVLALLGVGLVWLPALSADAAGPADSPIGPPVSSQALFACAPDGTQSSGAKYRICMPTFTPWNGDLIVYAHGYVSPTEPVHIPEDQLRLPNGTSIPDTVTFLGFAFATTSYSINGLAVRQGMGDLVDLVNIFRAAYPAVKRVYLVGPSEGGWLTTLGVERRPDVFDGGLAMCGPIGDFHGQINYLGDFRVVFDYFFPGLMPGSPISVPTSLMDTWDTYYPSTILPPILDPANAISVTQLLSVTHAAVDPADLANTVSNTIHILLWYSVFATNDATTKLGGQPFDNQSRVYAGSLDDVQLNAAVQRFSAEPAAIQEINAYYQTAGRPLVPLVTVHTTLDQTVPYWHALLYRDKIVAQRRAFWYTHLPVPRYGHCSFTFAEIQMALGLLTQRVRNPPVAIYWPLIRK